MTNFEKFGLECFNSHAISANKVKKGIAADDGILASHGDGVTFADSLYSMTAQTVVSWTSEGEEPVSEISALSEIPGISDVPTEWVYHGMHGGVESIAAVGEYLRSIGIEPQDREPTYQITDEQREWLESRHDMDALKTAGMLSQEWAYFMGDLYYLGVVSSSDVRAACTPEPVLPTNGNSSGLLGKSYIEPDPYGPALSYILQALANQEGQLGLAQKESQVSRSYLEEMRAYIDQNRRVYSLLSGFIGGKL